MKLAFRVFGDRTQPPRPLVLLHGLFGSAVNWQSLARQLSGQRCVLVPDQANHGDSPHTDEVGFARMSADLAELLDQEATGPVDLVGHSMGGKTAMALALTQPQRVCKLVVVDIAPVRYPNRLADLIDALLALDLSQVGSRRDADRALAAAIPDAQVRGFLLQNLRPGADERLTWRVNLAALRARLDDLIDFPFDPAEVHFDADTLFLYGGRSDYAVAGFEPQIRRFFPRARLQVIPDAGHWVYAEKPREFLDALQAELAR